VGAPSLEACGSIVRAAQPTRVKASPESTADRRAFPIFLVVFIFDLLSISALGALRGGSVATRPGCERLSSYALVLVRPILVLPPAMDSGRRTGIEDDIRRRCEAGDLDGATSAALRGYGEEVFDLLLALHRSEDEAGEVFSRFAEELWHSVGSFEWRCSFRTWAYVIARRASTRHRARAARRALHEVPLPEGSELSLLLAEICVETVSSRHARRRARLVELRDALPADDQTLIMLRVDRELAWNDLARVLHDGEGELDDDALKREAARLRKRFQLVKDKLYEMARREGLVTMEGGAPASRGEVPGPGRQRPK
jgi:RNA polymerase sigma-70 factor (ECF subfamily)